MDRDELWTQAIAILECCLRGTATLARQQAQLTALNGSYAVITVRAKWFNTLKARQHILAAALTAAAGQFLLVDLVPELQQVPEQE